MAKKPAPRAPVTRAPAPALKFTQISIAFQHDDPDVWIAALREDGAIFWKRRDDVEWIPDPAPLP